LRVVAAASREEAKSANHAKSAIDAYLRLQRQFFSQGAPLLFYSIPEVARDFLNVSRSTVYRLIEAGDLEVVHIRGCSRVPATSLTSFCSDLGLEEI
jgi:excisionase family DNA binding protein